MRISDWSSDVCSSDLRASGAAVRHRAGLRDRRLRRLAGGLGAGADPALGHLLRAGRPGVRRVPGTAGGAAGSDRRVAARVTRDPGFLCRSEEHTSELQSLMRISYAVFCLKKKRNKEILKYRVKKNTTKINKNTIEINRKHRI